MTYSITVNNQNVDILNGSVDETTSLELIGKNYPNYGQKIAQNFAKLLENFRGDTPPRNPVPGQLWWDSRNHALKVWSDQGAGLFKNIGAVTAGVDKPLNPLIGDLWWDYNPATGANGGNLVLKVYTGILTLGDNGWLIIGPTYPSTYGLTGFIVEEIPDSANVTHRVLSQYIDGTRVSITSQNDFTLKNSLPGRSQILAGFNMVLGVLSGTSTSAQYADLAEYYIADAAIEPGNIVVFGGDKEVTLAVEECDPRVAGIVSTQPAYIMNDQAAEGRVAVALTGKVPCRVKGPINKGDLVVTRGAPGVGQACNLDNYVPGCVVGKAMEDITDTKVHVINVAVGRY
jgi:hypothetical protein